MLSSAGLQRLQSKIGLLMQSSVSGARATVVSQPNGVLSAPDSAVNSGAEASASITTEAATAAAAAAWQHLHLYHQPSSDWTRLRWSCMGCCSTDVVQRPGRVSVRLRTTLYSKPPTPGINVCCGRSCGWQSLLPSSIALWYHRGLVR